MILFENCVTNAHYFRIDVPECAGVCQRRRSAAHQCRADVPRRCRGLTEDVTACAVRAEMRYNGRDGVVRRAVRSEMRYYGSGAVVRRADPFSVNPGQRVRG